LYTTVFSRHVGRIVVALSCVLFQLTFLLLQEFHISIRESLDSSTGMNHRNLSQITLSLLLLQEHIAHRMH